MVGQDRGVNPRPLHPPAPAGRTDPWAVPPRGNPREDGNPLQWTRVSRDRRVPRTRECRWPAPSHRWTARSRLGHRRAGVHARHRLSSQEEQHPHRPSRFPYHQEWPQWRPLGQAPHLCDKPRAWSQPGGATRRESVSSTSCEHRKGDSLMPTPGMMRTPTALIAENVCQQPGVAGGFPPHLRSARR